MQRTILFGCPTFEWIKIKNPIIIPRQQKANAFLSEEPLKRKKNVEKSEISN